MLEKCGRMQPFEYTPGSLASLCLYHGLKCVKGRYDTAKKKIPKESDVGYHAYFAV